MFLEFTLFLQKIPEKNKIRTKDLLFDLRSKHF